MAKIIVQEGSNNTVNAMSTWTNPTDQEVYLKFFDSNGRKMGDSPDAQVEPAQFSHFVIKPKEEITLSSKYDNAIQRVRNGVIVAGQGPQLQKKGEKKLPLHKAIDPDKASQAAQLLHAKHILEDFKSAQDAVTIAAAELIEKKSKKESK